MFAHMYVGSHLYIYGKRKTQLMGYELCCVTDAVCLWVRLNVCTYGGCHRSTVAEWVVFSGYVKVIRITRSCTSSTTIISYQIYCNYY